MDFYYPIITYYCQVIFYFQRLVFYSVVTNLYFSYHIIKGLRILFMNGWDNSLRDVE